jgi:hypothetical protein
MNHKCLMLLLPLLLLNVVYGATPTYNETFKNSLFDIIVELPDSYKTVQPGAEILTNIKLINLGSAGRVDVYLDYWITSQSNVTVLTKKETVAVETQANFVRAFDLPQEIDKGIYNIHARITYSDGKTAAASHSFEVAYPKLNSVYYFIVGILCFVVLVFTAHKLRPSFRRFMIRTRVSGLIKKKIKN